MSQPQPIDEFEYEHEARIKAEWKPKLTAIRWNQLDVAGAESEWLIQNVITGGEVSMLVGPSQHGKSFFAVEMGLCVALGREFFGHATEKGGVLYIAAESGRGLKKRLRAYRTWHEMNPDTDVPFVLLPGKFNLFVSDEDTAALILDGQNWNEIFLEQFGVPLRLIIIDTLGASITGADENSYKDISPVLARAVRISEELKCAVSVVHHKNAGGSKPRGHTAMFANVENVVSVELLPERVDEDGRAIRQVKVDKQKDAEAGESWNFVLRSVEVGTDNKGRPITSCVCVPPNGQVDVSGPADGGFEGTDNDRQFLTAMMDALKNDGETPPSDVPCPARITKAVRAGRVKKLVWDRFAGGEDGDEKQKKQRMRQRWKRAHDRMVQYGIVGSYDPEGGAAAWLWPTGKPVKGMTLGGERRKDTAPPEPVASTLSLQDENDFLSDWGGSSGHGSGLD